MAAFQDTKEQVEQKVIMHLLSEVERNPSFTQRKLAMELGIALGLINKYLQRCVTKGWIRVSQVSPRRIGYFLTPEGFMEKSEMVAGYLTRSLTFFRDARLQCEETLARCSAEKWNRIALLGEGDLADIAMLVAHGTGVELDIISSSSLTKNNIQEFVSSIPTYDAFIVTDVANPQYIYDQARCHVEEDRLLTLPLLYISTQRKAA